MRHLTARIRDAECGSRAPRPAQRVAALRTHSLTTANRPRRIPRGNAGTTREAPCTMESQRSVTQVPNQAREDPTVTTERKRPRNLTKVRHQKTAPETKTIFGSRIRTSAPLPSRPAQRAATPQSRPARHEVSRAEYTAQPNQPRRKRGGGRPPLLNPPPHRVWPQRELWQQNAQSGAEGCLWQQKVGLFVFWFFYFFFF